MILFECFSWPSDCASAAQTHTQQDGAETLLVPTASDQLFSPRVDASGVTPRDDAHGNVIRIRRKCVQSVRCRQTGVTSLGVVLQEEGAGVDGGGADLAAQARQAAGGARRALARRRTPTQEPRCSGHPADLAHVRDVTHLCVFRVMNGNAVLQVALWAARHLEGSEDEHH